MQDSLNQAIRIEAIHVPDLPDFARRAAAERRAGEVIPITEHCALAQSRNPNAAPDDVGLLVAFQGDRCVGCLGLLPGRLQMGAELAPVYWMSTWLMSSELRGQRVGYRLLEAARKLGYDLMISAFSRSAGQVVRAAGFRELESLKFYAIDFRRFSSWMGRLQGAVHRLRGAPRGTRSTGVLRSFDRSSTRAIRSAAYHCLQGGVSACLDQVRWEQVTEVGAEMLPEASAAEGVSRFVRGPEIVNWMLRDPWVLEASPAADWKAERYYFSDTRWLFRRFPFFDEPGLGPTLREAAFETVRGPFHVDEMVRGTESVPRNLLEDA